jgi:hypothetical protein
VSLDEFGPEFGIEYCEFLFRCCDYYELQDLGQDKFTTLQGCIDFTSLFFRDITRAWREAFAAGRGTHDPLAAGACLESMGTVSCGADLANLFSGCGEFFHGTQPVDAPCANDVECVDGADCVIPQGEDAGTCAPFLALGAVCNMVPSALCEPRTLYCDAQTHLCAERRPAGAPCVLTSQCQEGLECPESQCVTPVRGCDGA